MKKCMYKEYKQSWNQSKEAREEDKIEFLLEDKKKNNQIMIDNDLFAAEIVEE